MNDKDVFSKVPHEVIGLVLKNLDEDNPVEELKKCKLVSSRLYKATQDLFQDDFDQKLCTHFDGSKLNFTRSRTFGMNIFGSYKLNFSTIKISWAEYYLMKSWLEKLIPTNIQILELKDNLLNWKEMIDVLAKFPKIVHLKYIQSSDDMIVADKIHDIYSFRVKEYDTEEDFFLKIKEMIQVKPEFLPKLKIFEIEVVHWSISNIFSLLVNYSQCQNLEKFAIKVDLFGINKSEHSKCYFDSSIFTSPKIDENHIKSLLHLTRFARSMKSIEIIIDDSKLPQIEANYLRQTTLMAAVIRISSISVIQSFSEEKLFQFDQLESLVLKSPILYPIHVLKNTCKLSEFVNNQKNLQNFEISHLDGQLKNMGGHSYNDKQEVDFLKSLLIHKNTSSKTIRFEYHVGYNSWGMKNILQFSENLSALKVMLITFNTTWKFSDANIPKYPNCLELRIENTGSIWDNYEFHCITEKFQNLEKLIIVTKYWEAGPKVIDQDFQLIIRHLAHLKMIYFENSSLLKDSALTGLTLEAIDARKENPSEPIVPEDRIGLPISHLKNLESLDIINKGFRIEISDITAHHAFENMPKLKFLNLHYSNITREGFETILKKSGSKNLNIEQLTTEQIPSAFEDEDDEDIIEIAVAELMQQVDANEDV